MLLSRPHLSYHESLGGVAKITTRRVQQNMRSLFSTKYALSKVYVSTNPNIMKVLVLLKLSPGQQYFTYTNYILTPLCVSVCLIALHQKQINCFEEISLFYLLLAKIKYA